MRSELNNSVEKYIENIQEVTKEDGDDDEEFGIFDETDFER